MSEFWEEAFKEKQEMWGFTPVRVAVITADLFAKNGFKEILIPGIGYGRNAQPFLDKGIEVTGIEISLRAIELAKRHFGTSLKIHHGSVTEMPFDDNRYEGIFSHALIHLLDEDERIKLIGNCYNQLSDNGMMVFTAITKEAATYGQGKLIGKDRYEQFGGVNMFFYDEKTIQQEFESFGLIEIDTVTENYPFYLIQCRQ